MRDEGFLGGHIGPNECGERITKHLDDARQMGWRRETSMGSSPQISGGSLARNTGLNIIGQVVPLLVGLGAIPYVVRGLGTERFGILSIAWVLLGYFSLFDLGLGRATTKFVAECLGRGELHHLPGYARIAEIPISRLPELLPDRWKAALAAKAAAAPA